jgi:hypothetical protein
MISKSLLQSRRRIAMEVPADQLRSVYARQDRSLSGGALRQAGNSEPGVGFRHYTTERQARTLVPENGEVFRVQTVERIVLATRSNSHAIDKD